MSNIKIDDDIMQTVVAKAILEGIGPEQQNLLIEQAIRYLNTAPDSRGYGGPKPVSPLQDAFDSAVRIAAGDVVRELVRTEEYGEQIRAKIAEVVSAFLEDEYQMTDAIGEAVGTVISEKLRRG